MLKKISFVLACSIISANLACTSATAPEANSNAGNTAAANQKLPEGLSTSPVPISGTTPGIPDAANLNKPFKPGATPTPGIPDPKTLQKQLTPPLANQPAKPQTDSPAANANTANKTMMTTRKPPANQ